MIPDTITDVEQLEELLSRPTDRAVEALRAVPGDVLIAGAGGEMGPTLTRMVIRGSAVAGRPRRVIAVSRFGDSAVRRRLDECGADTIAGDLLDRDFLDTLPNAPNVIFMAGMKFGGAHDLPLTWAMNAHLPSLICERFQHSRIVAFSTGNVYGLVHRDSGGSTEKSPVWPVGEYAMSCLGRERMFQYFSLRDRIPTVLLRLNYATELRYGVLVDLAQKVAAGEPIDLGMSYVNVIWQGDASSLALCTLGDCGIPATVANIAGSAILRVRDICEQLADRLGTRVSFAGDESDLALLNNGSHLHQKYGEPSVSIERLLDWTADWIARGGPTHGKPTRFESQDGQF